MQLTLGYFFTLLTTVVYLVLYKNIKYKASLSMKIVIYTVLFVMYALINFLVIHTGETLSDINRYSTYFYNDYLYYYSNLLESFTHRHGFIWILLNKIFYTANLSPYLLYSLVSSSFYLTSILLINKISQDKTFRVYATLFFFTLPVAYYSNQMMRQVVSICFINLSMMAWFSNRNVLAFILYFVSILAHITPLMLLPLFILYDTKHTKFAQELIIIISVIGILLFYPVILPILLSLPVVGNYLLAYDSSFFTSNRWIITAPLYWVAIYITLGILYLRNAQHNQSFGRFKKNYIILGTTFAAATGLSAFAYTYLDRVLMFFFTSASLGFALAITSFGLKENRKIASIVLISISISLSFYMVARLDGILPSISS